MHYLRGARSPADVLSRCVSLPPYRRGSDPASVVRGARRQPGWSSLAPASRLVAAMQTEGGQEVFVELHPVDMA
jgi:hypothetical protein